MLVVDSILDDPALVDALLDDALLDDALLDDALVDAEFEAIVAANWPTEASACPTPPVAEKGIDAQGWLPFGSGLAPRSTPVPHGPAQRTPGSGRQRSPPRTNRADPVDRPTEPRTEHLSVTS